MLKDGDIINIDVTVKLEGYHGDTSKTFFVGNVSHEIQNLFPGLKRQCTSGLNAFAQINILVRW